MKAAIRIWTLFLLLAAVNRCYAQVETKRWWNIGATTDRDRAVFCADEEAAPLEELLQALKKSNDDRTRLHLYLRVVRSYQDKTIIFRAIAYADSALALSTKLGDSLSICRTHTASVYNMYMCGNPSGMLERARLAQQFMPSLVRGTMEDFKVNAVTGDAYNSLVQYDEAEQYYQKAKKIAAILESEKCVGYVNMSLGRTRQSNGKLDKAIEAYQEGLTLFEAYQDTLTCCVLYSHIASAYSGLGARDLQLKNLDKVLKLSESLRNPIHQASIYRDIGSFYRAQNDSTLTTEYYNKAIIAYRKVPHAFSPELGDSYNDMADFYHYMGDREKALHYQRLSIDSYRAYPRPVSLMYYKMGYLYHSYGELDSAYHYYKDAYHKSLVLNDPRLSATCTKGLANYYREIGNIKRAIDYAEIAYADARKIGWIEFVCEISGLMSQLYADARDYQKAYVFQMTYRELTDSLKLAENNREAARLSAQSEFADREARMSLQIADQKRQIRLQGVLSILLVCILGLVTVICIIVLRNNKHRKQVNLQLSEQRDELTSFNEELAATNEELAATNEELQRTYEELNHYKNDLEEIVNKKTGELQRAFIQVQESDRFKSAFFANMSHEIRTPLNAILGFLQFIGKPDIGSVRQERMKELINANAGQLVSLVDDIVDLSKADSGLLTIRPDLYNIDKLLTGVHEHTERLVRYSNKNKLELLVENRLPDFYQPYLIDGERISQVMIRLLDNAVKFTESGYVMFGCELQDHGTYLRFFVEDTGIGISSENQPEIFKRFWKQGDAYTQRYRGVGIGLSLCESLVGLMGGTFHVDSHVGQGSTFGFTIKICEEK